MPVRSRNYTYKFPRPAVTVDIVLITRSSDQLRVLLIRRKARPYAGCWALPGGFVDMHEALKESALRELKEETGISRIRLMQMGAFGTPARDPRGRTITVAYYGLLPETRRICQGDDAMEVAWFDLKKLPRLAFDHTDIIKAVLVRLRHRSEHYPLFLDLLPDCFTLAQAVQAAQSLSGKGLKQQTLKKNLLESGVLRETGKFVSGDRKQISKLYELNRAAWRRLCRQAAAQELRE